MRIELTDDAATLIQRKGGTVAIDFIAAVG